MDIGTERMATLAMAEHRWKADRVYTFLMPLLLATCRPNNDGDVSNSVRIPMRILPRKRLSSERRRETVKLWITPSGCGR